MAQMELSEYLQAEAHLREREAMTDLMRVSDALEQELELEGAAVGPG